MDLVFLRCGVIILVVIIRLIFVFLGFRRLFIVETGCVKLLGDFF